MIPGAVGCTWTHVEFEVLCDGADGAEVSGVVEVFLQWLRCDLTQLFLHSFSDAHGVHGDPCAHTHTHLAHTKGVQESGYRGLPGLSSVSPASLAFLANSVMSS